MLSNGLGNLVAKVQMLMERLKGGASFQDLAMRYSEDADSAPRGGDLGGAYLSLRVPTDGAVRVRRG